MQDASELTDGPHWVRVAREYEDAVVALGLPARDAFDRLVAQLDGPSGRGANALLPLAGRAERLHLRPLRHGGLLGSFLGDRFLSSQRVRSEFQVTRALARRGAPVPVAVLATAVRSGPFWRAAFGTIHLEGASDALAWLARKPHQDEINRGAAALGTAVRAFHDAGGHHADLHLKNLMLDNTATQAWVIDLDRARAASSPLPQRRMHELGRLARSLLKRGVHARVGRSGRAAFLQAYVAGDQALHEALVSAWPRERARIHRHAARYADPG